jgi:hypothetical protein
MFVDVASRVPLVTKANRYCDPGAKPPGVSTISANKLELLAKTNKTTTYFNFANNMLWDPMDDGEETKELSRNNFPISE